MAASCSAAVALLLLLQIVQVLLVTREVSARHNQAAAIAFAPVVDWSSGSAASTLPTDGFAVRKVEAFHYAPDGHTYAYADIINYTDYYYPDSYSSEVGVFSSPDGATGWQYHGIVVPRGHAGGWDAGGIASPGAAVVAADGSVIVGYAAENSPSGGRNRGIGVARARHPLGPFVKRATPVADPQGLCGGSGRCDDVIMQSSRDSGGHDSIHLYHSVKSSDVAPGCSPPAASNCIVHHVSTDNGETWSSANIVLARNASIMETIAGKYFPGLPGAGSSGAMVLITDGGPGNALTPFASTRMDGGFAPTDPPVLQAHPPSVAQTPTAGHWANVQVEFIPGPDGTPVTKIAYALWTDNDVHSGEHNATSKGYTHTVYNVTWPAAAVEE